MSAAPDRKPSLLRAVLWPGGAVFLAGLIAWPLTFGFLGLPLVALGLFLAVFGVAIRDEWELRTRVVVILGIAVGIYACARVVGAL